MDMAVLEDLVLTALDAPVKANFDALYNKLYKKQLNRFQKVY